MDTLKKDAGTVLMIGLPGPELAPETAERVESLAPGGLILFRRNLSEPDATSKLLSDTAARMPAPAWFAIDQEGGRVSRLAPWIGPTPTAAELAGAGVDTVTRFGRATGEALRGLGFNLDFAPVVDLSPVDADNGIGSRAYHPTPERTIEFARGFLVGLQGSGVAGCLKHFPGLGRTTVDSHQSLPQVQRSLGELESEELVPFRELCAEAASVMVGHGHYTALEPDAPVPASGSQRVVQGLLRGRLGYQGLVVSDDLEMGAVTDLDPDGGFGVRAIDAGCDLILYCSDLDRAEAARARLVERAAGDRSFAARLAEAADRVRRTAARWPRPTPELTHWEAARKELRGFA